MNDTNAKQQIVDRIKKSSTILVTVSKDPSVDELSAALGLTLLLNKMDKHATAVFSGAIPPAITFMDPERTFENTVDSLRDFIIALDKEKADHLRYKVDGDVVKIFITPYRTTITSDDLDFSQGDYNVELVLALGVKDQDHLDGALAAHGRILHDATVATISAGTDKSNLGSIDWFESGASSLSEMLVSLSDALKSDKALLDEQVATAFLTGVVAATDRFSNNRTSSKVMTIAAQLMAAGANQQLIALKLQEAHEIGGGVTEDAAERADGTTELSEGASTKLKKYEEPVPAEEPKKDDGELSVSHELDGTIEEVAQATAAEQQQEAAEVAEAELAKQEAKTPEEALADELATVAPAVVDTPSVADLQQDLAAASEELSAAAEPIDSEPSFGGTLNATTEQAAEDKRQAVESDRNRTILSHGSGDYIGDQTPSFQSPLNAAAQDDQETDVPDIFQQAQVTPAAPTIRVAPVEPPMPVVDESVAHVPTLAELDAQNRQPHEDARAAVDAAFGAVPYQPAPMPLPAPELEPLPAPQLPVMPPLPDFSTLPPLPDAPPAPFSPAPEQPQPPLPPAPTDPAQYRIPGQ
jgi:homeobox protein ESX1